MSFSNTISQNHLDVSTLSNFDKVTQKDYQCRLFINFEKQILEGFVIIEFQRLNLDESRIILDTKKLNISKVCLINADASESSLSFKVHHDHKNKSSLGCPLEILLCPEFKDLKFKIKVEYTTNNGNDGFQWMVKSQTLSQNKPFVFTQGEAILSRTIYPCQDTPSAKVTFSKVQLIVEEGVLALFGGIFVKKEEVEYLGQKMNEFTYEQKVCIPTYLFAVAAGELGFKKLSERCGIYAELPLLDKAAYEFEDTEVYLKANEDYLDYPYIWGPYNILILPQAFPFGGMENPNLTFINPALIVGDKSMVPTVAHEIAHSWTGNLVTNKDWNNFWMNEGFTVFMERKLCELVLGEEHALLEAEVGYNELLYAISAQGETHNYTQLHIGIGEEDPDDAFSVVPYEKGFNLLYYLETLIGKDFFRDILRKYIKKYAYQSIEFKNFKEVFESELISAGKENLLKEVDWNSWVYKPGYLVKEANFKTKLSEDAFNLFSAIKEVKINKDEARKTYLSFHANSKIVFLNHFLHHVSSLTSDAFELLKSSTDINNDLKHPEISYTWFQIAFAMKDKDSIEPGKKFLLKQGRMKYIRPVLRAFYRFDKTECLSFFNENKWIYHIVPVRIIEADFERIN